MKNAFRSRCEPAAQPTVTLVRYVRRRVHCANEVEDAGTPACVTKLEVPQRMQARRDRNGASAYTSGHRAQVAVCHRLCQPRTPAAPSASALMAKKLHAVTCQRSRFRADLTLGMGVCAEADHYLEVMPGSSVTLRVFSRCPRMICFHYTVASLWRERETPLSLQNINACILHLHTRPPPVAIRFSCACVCDSTEVT